MEDGQPIVDWEAFGRIFRMEILPLLQEYCSKEHAVLLRSWAWAWSMWRGSPFKSLMFFITPTSCSRPSPPGSRRSAAEAEGVTELTVEISLREWA